MVTVVQARIYLVDVALCAGINAFSNTRSEDFAFGQPERREGEISEVVRGIWGTVHQYLREGERAGSV